MKKFKDVEGRDWQIVVNVGSAKKVRDLTGVNLFDLFQSEAQRVFSDPCLLVDVLFVLCQEQCRERSITDEAFGRGLVGDAIEHAAEALLGEVADFFPSRRRTILRATMAKSEQMAVQLEAKALEAIEKISLQSLTSSPA
jgi:hypothetical protein